MTGNPPLSGHPTTRRRRRPAPVTILAVIQIILGVANLGVAGILLADPDNVPPVVEALIHRSTWAVVGGQALPLALGTIGVLDLVAAGLLLQLRRLGWTLTMLLSGFALSVLIVTYATTGEVSTIALLLNVVGVLYLNAGQTREAFGLVPVGHSSLEDTRG